MRKLTMLLLILLLLTGIHLPTKSEAGCPLGQPKGTVRAYAMQRVYTVGEAFRTQNIGMFIYWQANRSKYYGHRQIRYLANNVPIYDGYRFREPGKKYITLKYKNKQVVYEIVVNEKK